MLMDCVLMLSVCFCIVYRVASAMEGKGRNPWY